MGFLIKDMMTKKPVTVQLDDPLEIVKKIFESTGFHHLLVLEKRTLVGIISDRDLLKTLSPYLGTDAEMVRDAATLDKRAHQIMTRTPISLTAEQNIYDALELFLKFKISCLPVVDEERRAIGILSWRDIFRTVHERRQKKLAKLEKERLAQEKAEAREKAKEDRERAKVEKEQGKLEKAALDEVARGLACAIPLPEGTVPVAGLTGQAGAVRSQVAH